MGPDDPFAQQLFDNAGRLKVSLPCVRCGYDLRTLPCDGCCPECGAAVEETMRVLLSHRRPGRLAARLHTGLGMLALGESMVASAGPLTLVLFAVLRNDAGLWTGLILATGGPILVGLAGLWFAGVPRMLTLGPAARSAAYVHGWVQWAGALGLAACGGLVVLTMTSQSQLWTSLLIHLAGQVLTLPAAALHRLLALVLEAQGWPDADLRRLRRVSQGYAAASIAALVRPFSELARRTLHEQRWPLWSMVPSDTTWLLVLIAAYMLSAAYGAVVAWRSFERFTVRRRWLHRVVTALSERPDNRDGSSG